MAYLRLAPLGFGVGLLLAQTSWARADAPNPGAAKKPTHQIDLMLGNPRVQYPDTPLPQGDWSRLRRAVETRFHPTRSMITEDGRPMATARQVARMPEVRLGPPGRQLPPDEVTKQEAHEALQRAYDKPASMRAVEMATTTDEKGRIVSMKVVIPSGSQRFDDAAVEAVRDALAEYPLEETGRPLIMRWRIRGAYGVALPRLVTPPKIQHSSGRTSYTIPFPTAAWGTFDETKGKIQGHVAFEEKIETEVTLLSVTQAPE